MKFSVAAVAAFAGAASAGFVNVTTITIPHEITSTSIVNQYVTFCPEATTLTEGNKTIVVTKPGTITITDCPCTRTSTHTTVTVTTAPVSNGTAVLPPSIVPVTTAPGTKEAPKETPKETKALSSSALVVSNGTHTATAPAQGGAAAIGVSGALAGVVAAAAYLF
ncbi:hypothetical protein D0Z00_001544 [Geotrichum galactomycetum]|uniref:Uncharacterized protein n=1 Tax=Geotrichum galactomycetum TaxID=27317 RepID=A0ACB6V6N8_9ASCO|nr:hypothetical protein D0Z00_001544 [Geotrichum candidum]